MLKVGFDKRLAVRTIAFAAMLCWPLLMIGRPAYFPDSAGYFNGGQTAVQTLISRLAPPPVVQAEAAQPGATLAPVPHVGGTRAVRSIPYSLLAYALAGRDAAMLPLAIFQAMVTGFTLAAFLAAAAVSRARQWAVAAIIALATPAAWVVGVALPDIFAGLLILVVATLSVNVQRITRPVAITLGVIGTAAVAFHPSHLAIMLLLLPLIALRPGRSLRWVLIPTVLGVVAVVAGGLVGFHELSLAPKRYPLTLGRSIGDGPARWYLQRHCATAHYAVCEMYGVAIPPDSNAFLWGPDGISRRATADQMERLRDEEYEIVTRAALDYPVEQITASLAGIARQLISFSVKESNFDVRIGLDAKGEAEFVSDPRMPAALVSIADALSRITALLAIAWLIFSVWRGDRDRRDLASILLAGIVANAVVCAVLSGSSDRYQARVVWLLPIAALLLPLRPFRRAESLPLTAIA